MGLFDMFGKKFEDQIQEAVNSIGSTTPGLEGLHAEVNGKVVTLKGRADSRETANLAMEKLDQAVKADNIVNAIVVEKAEATAPVTEAASAPTPAAAERTYEVVAGDTLGAISQKFYGQAGQYMKIFEANRDILDDPNLIKVGQKLRIPE
ncbi:MAG: LysM peptidoglycan-binding domain-containing protein [Thermoanaerobaculales bacterium]